MQLSLVKLSCVLGNLIVAMILGHRRNCLNPQRQGGSIFDKGFLRRWALQSFPTIPYQWKLAPKSRNFGVLIKIDPSPNKNSISLQGTNISYVGKRKSHLQIHTFRRGYVSSGPSFDFQLKLGTQQNTSSCISSISSSSST